MERPELITFDCAHTLVETNWTLDGFARSTTEAIGLKLPEAAFPRLLQLFQVSLQSFLSVNSTRNLDQVETFWRELTRAWFVELGVSESFVEPAREAANRLAYGPDSVLFKLYPDTVPCLDALQKAGFRLAIVSNWDTGLHRVIESFGLTNRFELILASLEEGVEKPDPRLFQICLDRLGVPAAATLHVGDDLIDDIQGAQSAGIRAIHLDRTATAPQGSTISSLLQLPEVLNWTV